MPSGHPLQESDDCLMWDRLGLEWFSTGYYSQSEQPGDLPYIKHSRIYNEVKPLFDLIQKSTHPFDKPEGDVGKKNKQWTGLDTNNLFRFSKKMLRKFDAIFFNFFIENVEDNWGRIKNFPLFFKTYSMHPVDWEHKIGEFREKGLTVIRNSPKEHLRPIYAGHDAIIRGSVVRDEDEFSGWIGDKKSVVTFSNYIKSGGMAERRRLRYYKILRKTSNYPFELYGVGNQNILGSPGFVTHEKKLDILRHARVSLIIGTPNSNNTYSMVESWIMGVPIVVFGKRLWQSASYEADELIQNGVDGFYSDSLSDLRKYIHMLMTDDELAKRISEAGRKKAISIYGRQVLSEQWRQLFIKRGLNLEV